MAATREELDRTVELVLENWDAIGVEEFDGVLHMPATIKSRTKEGKLIETPVRLRNITNAQRYRCRTDSRAWALKLGLDLDRDSDLVSQLEDFCILAFAIREPENFVQHCPDGEALWRQYGPGSLNEIWGRYDAWIRMIHPSFGKFDGEQMWQIIARIKGAADITPLAVMPGIEQASCILLMAREACNSPNAPSWLRSSATSTPAPSRSPSSEAS